MSRRRTYNGGGGIASECRFLVFCPKTTYTAAKIFISNDGLNYEELDSGLPIYSYYKDISYSVSVYKNYKNQLCIVNPWSDKRDTIEGKTYVFDSLYSDYSETYPIGVRLVSPEIDGKVYGVAHNMGQYNSYGSYLVSLDADTKQTYTEINRKNIRLIWHKRYNSNDYIEFTTRSDTSMYWYRYTISTGKTSNGYYLVGGDGCDVKAYDPQSDMDLAFKMIGSTAYVVPNVSTFQYTNEDGTIDTYISANHVYKIAGTNTSSYPVYSPESEYVNTDVYLSSVPYDDGKILVDKNSLLDLTDISYELTEYITTGTWDHVLKSTRLSNGKVVSYGLISTYLGISSGHNYKYYLMTGDDVNGVSNHILLYNGSVAVTKFSSAPPKVIEFTEIEE